MCAPTTTIPDEGHALPPESPADLLWDDWDEPPRMPLVPVLHLDGFDGPMDLLLDLAERQRIDLGRISIVALAEQFVVAMERLASRVPIERRADWLVLATRLVLLRARLLFPSEAEAVVQQDAARGGGSAGRDGVHPPGSPLVGGAPAAGPGRLRAAARAAIPGSPPTWHRWRPTWSC